MGTGVGKESMRRLGSGFSTLPDFDSWDAEDIRTAMIETQGFMESPKFRIEEVPERLRKYIPKERPGQVSLLNMELFEIPPAECLLVETRHRSHGEVHYSTAIMILFAQCFWGLTIEVEDKAALVGEREGAVARSILDGKPMLDTPIDEVDPYDRRWDGIVPIEDDPLTRMRLLMPRLRGSIRLDNRLLELKPFAP
jgi:hypothetical protein